MISIGPYCAEYTDQVQSVPINSFQRHYLATHVHDIWSSVRRMFIRSGNYFADKQTFSIEEIFVAKKCDSQLLRRKCWHWKAAGAPCRRHAEDVVAVRRRSSHRRARRPPPVAASPSPAHLPVWHAAVDSPSSRHLPSFRRKSDRYLAPTYCLSSDPTDRRSKSAKVECPSQRRSGRTTDWSFCAADVAVLADNTLLTLAQLSTSPTFRCQFRHTHSRRRHYRTCRRQLVQIRRGSPTAVDWRERQSSCN